jgi:hydroxyacylglutathione hydrolase
MIVERSMSDGFLTNNYIVADEPGGHAVMIDAGGPVAPLIEFVKRGQLTLTHILLTHHHGDHVVDLDEAIAAFPDAPVLIHELERSEVPQATGTLAPGETIRTGALTIEPLHTPGHTAGMLSLLVDGTDVFTGDTLFKGSVGGVRAPGSTSYADLKSSIMDTLMSLPRQTRVHPGHTDPTTIGDEWENNAFIRVWRGLDPESDEHCTVEGEGATLVLFAPDYDGGHKAWVRWDGSGKDDIVPGSRVVRE